MIGALLALGACRPPHRTITGLDLDPATRLGRRLLRTALNLMRHTAWVSRKVKDIGPALKAAGVRLLGEVIEVDQTGTQAYVATSGRDLVIAFRGTGGETLRKWIRSVVTDLRFLPRQPAFPNGKAGRDWGRLKVHSGFHDAYMKKRAKILGYVRANPRHRIYVTGHSLGAAMATLAAFDLSRNLKRPVVARLFAAPRVGNSAFARAFAKAVPDAIRIEHLQDPITRVPPDLPFARYTHVGKLLAFRPDGTLATARELRGGDTGRLSVKVHFQPIYRRALRRLFAWCRKLPDKCENRSGPDRLAALADAERSLSRRWLKAGWQLLKRLFGGKSR